MQAIFKLESPGILAGVYGVCTAIYNMNKRSSGLANSGLPAVGLRVAVFTGQSPEGRDHRHAIKASPD